MIRPGFDEKRKRKKNKSFNPTMCPFPTKFIESLFSSSTTVNLLSFSQANHFLFHRILWTFPPWVWQSHYFSPNSVNLSEPILSPIFSFLSASWLSHDSRLRVVCRVLWSMCLTWRAMSFRPLCSLTLAIAPLHREHAVSWDPVLFLIWLVVNLTHVASHGSFSLSLHCFPTWFIALQKVWLISKTNMPFLVDFPAVFSKLCHGTNENPNTDKLSRAFN